MNDIEAKDAAIERAIADGAVVVYFTLDRLLAAFMPADFRQDIRAAFEERGPLPNEARWRVAHVRLEDMPREDQARDGQWCVRFPDDHDTAYTLVIVSDHTRYDGARANFRKLQARKRQQVPLN